MALVPPVLLAPAARTCKAAQKLNLSSPHRRRRSSDESSANAPDASELVVQPNGYAARLLKSPPPAPPALVRRIGSKELSGVGKR
ncbi:kinesin-like protein KIF26B [Phymastichus coffea]|uniref:kinesin-like protein KIF26B n=1 Tax=Phymastichus coffea TaxID=108790 RepID=UPI00273AE808|nr:kinesin-like protein KIF26B [Phymastichus coffea]